MARWLEGLGWAGTGYTPSFAPGTGPGASIATPSPTMTMSRTSVAASTSSPYTTASLRTGTPSSPAPLSFDSFPPGSGSVTPATPAAGGSSFLPAGSLLSPSKAGGSVFTPDGGGTSSSDVSGDTAQSSGGGSTSIATPTPAPMLTTSDYVTGFTSSWKIAALLALGGAAAWYFGMRIVGGVALAGAGLIGWRAYRST